MRRPIAFAAALSVVLAAPRAFAYPISPVPLWQLVERSEGIVVAGVVAVGEYAGSSEDDWNSALATLHVLETWKAPTDVKIQKFSKLEVPFPANVICPAPPRYVVGQRVVAFLARDKDSGRWETVALSYGTLYPDDAGLAEYRDRVREAVALISNSPVSREAWLTWHARAAATPATRWHGLYELMPETDELHSFYDRETKHDPATASVLTKEHLALIADGFIQAPSTDRTLPMALSLLSGYVNADLDRAIVAGIEGVLAQPKQPWWLGQTLQLALERVGEKKAVATRAKGRPTSFDLENQVGDLKNRWAQEKARLKIAPSAPAPVKKPLVPGTGENTPS